MILHESKHHSLKVGPKQLMSVSLTGPNSYLHDCGVFRSWPHTPCGKKSLELQSCFLTHKKIGIQRLASVKWEIEAKAKALNTADKQNGGKDFASTACVGFLYFFSPSNWKQQRYVSPVRTKVCFTRQEKEDLGGGIVEEKSQHILWLCWIKACFSKRGNKSE